METPNDNVLPEERPEVREPAPPVATVSPLADSAMATGTDNEPDMTIADKHTGDPAPDPDGDGKLSMDEAATLLGDDSGSAEDQK